jgi:hypothetical protein
MNGPSRFTGRHRLGRGTSFSVLVFANVVLMASTSAPSPIYPLYLQRWGFSVTMTVVFAVYVAGLVAALLTVGSLSDHLGRRPVLIASLLLAAAGTAIFWTAGGFFSLVLARIVQGIATGTATGALAAGLVEFSPAPQWWDRLPVTPFDYNNIRERIIASRWRVRFKIADCAIVTTTAIGLTAVSLVLAAPASATNPHGTHGPANHTAMSASQERDESAGDSSQPSRRDDVDNVGKVATDPSVGEPATAAEPDTANPEASEVWLPGHDKCKRPKAPKRPLLPWCTDPAAGWIESTTHRAENNPANPTGICDASSLHPASRCRPTRQPLP